MSSLAVRHLIFAGVAQLIFSAPLQGEAENVVALVVDSGLLKNGKTRAMSTYLIVRRIRKRRRDREKEGVQIWRREREKVRGELVF